MAETKQRAAERHRCWLKALFVFNDGRSSLDAIARNVSEIGALLECENIGLLPDDFDLIITQANGEPFRRRARQVWAHNGALGVKFLDAESSTPSGDLRIAQAS